MKKIHYFYFESCPYCRQAERWMQELRRENDEFARVEILRTDERLDPETADRFDYYYVPTFFVGGVKAHEGAATREDVRRVFERALEE